MFSLFMLFACAHDDRDVPGPSCGNCSTTSGAFIEKSTRSAVLITGIAKQNDVQIGEWYGSGAIVGHHDKLGTAVLTAGHVCMPEMPPTKEGDPPIEWGLQVADKGEKIHKAYAAFVSKDFDACVLHIPLIDIPALDITTKMPKIGDEVVNISSPFAIYSKDISLIFAGHYSGRFQKGDSSTYGVFTFPSGPGASGSPILDAHGHIVGVVSRVNRQLHHIVLSPTYEDLQLFFAGKANVVPITFSF
tara:strand:- start:1219 stop:1956 length:738 start_codon:yes stop_codon:yes gene_type:complete